MDFVIQMNYINFILIKFLGHHHGSKQSCTDTN